MTFLGIAIVVWLTWQVLAPQLTSLMTVLHLPAADQIGSGLAILILVGAAVSKMSKTGGQSVSWAIIVLTMCVGITRAKVVTGQMNSSEARYVAERAAYDEAKRNRGSAIEVALADPDLRARPPYLNRKREALANLAAAQGLALPPVPVKPTTGISDWLLQVLGPAGVEAATAVVIKFLGGQCGASLVLLLAPVWARQKGFRQADGDVSAKDEFQGVDLSRLDQHAREGLDLDAGTWRGLPLGGMKPRRGVMWPTLAKGRGRTIFVGSVPARRLAEEKFGQPSRPNRQRVPAAVVPLPTRAGAADNCVRGAS